MSELNLTNCFVIGRNAQYQFCIGQMGERWAGFAKAGEAIFLFSQVGDGYNLGFTSRQEALRMTSAIIQDGDIEGSYGPVEKWFIPEGARGDPDDYRCDECGEIGCIDRACEDGNYDNEEE